jgi:tetratricopeptide (TPR) repeat protein
LAYLEKKEAGLAAEQFRQCVAKRNRPALAPVNKEIHKAGPNHCLALCLAALKQPAAAEAAFRAALADDPKSRSARFDYARFLQQQGKSVEALQRLHELAIENPADALVWEFGGQVALSRPEFLEFAGDWTAEAVKHAPQQTAILRQHAEALLLGQQPQAALPFWRQARAADQPRYTAALVLCELLTGETSPPPAASEETAVSQEFLNWYRRLVLQGAGSLVVQVNERLDRLAGVLPSATKVLEAVVREADSLSVER